MSIENPDLSGNQEKREGMQVDLDNDKATSLKVYLESESVKAEKEWREYSDVVRELRKRQTSVNSSNELQIAELEYLRLFDVYMQKQSQFQRYLDGEKTTH